VVGFPLLTSFALVSAPASHGAVVIAVLPAATAVAAVLRTGEHPQVPPGPPQASAPSLLGRSVPTGGRGRQSGPSVRGSVARILLFGAVLSAAIGYAEGGMLARELGAWQTVCWALVVCAPLMGLRLVPRSRHRPMAQISQVQLVQPVMSITRAGLLPGEHIAAATLLGGLAVIACAGTAVRARVH
jgi:hypothetical protein